MLRRHIVLGLASTVLVSCSQSLTDNEQLAITEEVTATRVDGAVRVANATSRAIGYAVVNPRWLGLIGTCAEPTPSCTPLATGATATVRDADIHGYEPSAPDALVYWWHVVPDGAGGFRTDLHQIVVPLS